MSRLTAKDYRKQLKDLEKQQIALKNRIKDRANKLCEKYPDIQVGYRLDDNNANKPFYSGEYIGFRITIAEIEDVLQIIETIEKELANRHPHKQGTIEGF